MRARIHVYRVDDAALTDAVHVPPEELLEDDVVAAYPSLEDALVTDSETEVRTRHAEAVDAWRSRARESIVDAVELEIGDEPHRVDVKRLGCGFDRENRPRQRLFGPLSLSPRTDRFDVLIVQRTRMTLIVDRGAGHQRTDDGSTLENETERKRIDVTDLHAAGIEFVEERRHRVRLARTARRTDLPRTRVTSIRLAERRHVIESESTRRVARGGRRASLCRPRTGRRPTAASLRRERRPSVPL